MHDPKGCRTCLEWLGQGAVLTLSIARTLRSLVRESKCKLQLSVSFFAARRICAGRANSSPLIHRSSRTTTYLKADINVGRNRPEIERREAKCRELVRYLHATQLGGLPVCIDSDIASLTGILWIRVRLHRLYPHGLLVPVKRRRKPGSQATWVCNAI